jgi:hypothetical protein
MTKMQDREPDPLGRGKDLRIRIRTKMSRIRIPQHCLETEYWVLYSQAMGQ